jgi:hypothetical protein
LQDYSAYDSFNTYTGVLWLPAGICNDIQIESNVYTCTVVASNTPFANIIQ